MRKLASVFLAVAMLWSCSFTAFAYTYSDIAGSPALVSDTDSLETYALDTEFDDIKMSVAGNYALELSLSEDDIVDVPTGRLDVDILNDIEFALAMQNPAISNPVKDSLRTHRELLLNNGLTSYVATIFSPQFLPMTRSETYITYKGHQMKNERIYYKGLEPDQSISLASGVDTAELMDDIFNISLIGVGVIGGSFPVITFSAAGLSLFALFTQKFEDMVVTGSTRDYSNLQNMSYDKIEQLTWTNVLGDWKIGLYSEYVRVNKVVVHQYYYNSSTQEGNSYDLVITPNKECETENFSYPYPVAFQNMDMPLNESISYRIGRKLLVF